MIMMQSLLWTGSNRCGKIRAKAPGLRIKKKRSTEKRYLQRGGSVDVEDAGQRVQLEEGQPSRKTLCRQRVLTWGLRRTLRQQSRLRLRLEVQTWQSGIDTGTSVWDVDPFVGWWVRQRTRGERRNKRVESEQGQVGGEKSVS